ncbi:response regulator, receiver domain (plasmid) [Legionella adelaidensis]|uniref:CheY-like receiver n=1 Tax=Legionella adelaidensis TaxID=45056 RepID=A0A0W0R5D8_9GAMM|nr:response regulator [Legionella adelaidensis]KTC66285.1 CheY-like receiver [Legionella adelaidensis]VEH84881.1 response regulator, receiver domain [Legionella adelaidensis]
MLDTTHTPILYVEDDIVDLESVKREFNKINGSFIIYSAKNGIEALDKLYGRNGHKKLDPFPKAILLDIKLPKMNGIEFLTALRENPQFNSIMVFVVTSLFSSKDKIALQNLGIVGSLIKPLQHSDALDIYWCVNSGADAGNILFS